MVQKLLASALTAGCAAWLLAALLHFAFVQKYILLGEDYETGVAVHFSGAGAAVRSKSEDAAASDDHGNGDATGESSAIARNFWTVVFLGLVNISSALVLVAGFGLARIYGHRITAREGLLWGIAGFAAFQLAPAMGLAPQLPGIPAADLGDRQLWWFGTVAATAMAFALLAYGKGSLTTTLAVILLAVPHIVGAPELDSFSGAAPPELAASFAARVLGMGLAVWAVMGWVAGWVWDNTGQVSEQSA